MSIANIIHEKVETKCVMGSNFSDRHEFESAWTGKDEERLIIYCEGCGTVIEVRPE